MGLQNKLNQALQLLLKVNTLSSSVFVHEPTSDNLFHYVVVININYQGKLIKSSSAGSSLFTTFLKALGELGENIISLEMNFENRSGMAGGILRKSSVIRAKAELIERDAFLYHYRGIAPFIMDEADGISIGYRLNSIDASFKVFFTMSSRYLQSPDSCLVFGMGSDVSLKAAKRKAYSEFSSMYLNHAKFQCKVQDFNNPSLWHRKTDFHHNESRSLENKLIFKNLCSGKSIFEKRHYDPALWKIIELKSPIKYFKFVKVYHPQLMQLKFGEAENFPRFSNTVFHPFW